MAVMLGMAHRFFGVAADSGHSIAALKRCAHANGIPVRQGLRGSEAFPPAVWNTMATLTDVRRVRHTNSEPVVAAAKAPMWRALRSSV